MIGLIVTIIVLLILAGVSLNLVAGSDGIISKASNAVSETKKATIKEEVELLIAELQMDYYSDYANNKANYSTALDYAKAELQEGDQKTGSGVTIKYTDPKYYYDDIEFEIDTNGNVKVGEQTGNSGGTTTPTTSPTVTETPSPTVTTTPEVAKYTVSYNANGGETTPESETDLVAGTVVTLPTSARTGYVFLGWATSQTATTEEFTGTYTVSGDVTLYAVWEETQAYNSKRPWLHIPTGFSVAQDVEGNDLDDVSNGYVITDSEGNEFVWIPVKNDAAYTKKLGKNNWYVTSGSTGEDLATTLGNDVTKAVQGDRMLVSGAADTTVLGTTFTDDLVAESTAIANRPEYQIVKKAGGFWVGRYEAGVVSDTEHGYIAEITDGSNTKYNESNEYWTGKTIVVKPGAEPARAITQTKALEIANSWKSGTANLSQGTVAFKSGLITGAQWDAMCNFIGWDTCNSDCTNWGNYNNVASAPYSGLHSNDLRSDWVQGDGSKKQPNTTNRWIFPTGKFIHDGKSEPSTSKNNIFDVAGNVWEWTTEISQFSSANAVFRGGSADNAGGYYLATHRNGYYSATTGASWNIGFRLVLYVQ